MHHTLRIKIDISDTAFAYKLMLQHVVKDGYIGNIRQSCRCYTEYLVGKLHQIPWKSPRDTCQPLFGKVGGNFGTLREKN